MSTTSGTVSVRAQSRCNSQASDTQLMGWAPAWTMRSRPARCASGDVPPTGPRLVPQDPVALDELSPRTKRGYVIFGWLSGAPVAMALGTDLAVARLLSPNAQVGKAAPAVVGKGGKGSGPRKPFVSKTAPDAARALTRLYARASEAAAMAAREEADRHLFDAPEKRGTP